MCCSAPQPGHLRNEGRFLLGSLTTISSRCEEEPGTTESLRGRPTQKRSLSIAKTMGTCRLKAGDRQQAFHATHSSLFVLHAFSPYVHTTRNGETKSSNCNSQELKSGVETEFPRTLRVSPSQCLYSVPLAVLVSSVSVPLTLCL
uniref:Uncharacterized protein n=1 Tax=Rousettus aegyptiacus TaxID=9407 RepID=A0A7J8EZS7_ROUAE|nr:hypothetical protein HJG63_012237 [Rousettus aegyptiacus]